MPRYKIAGRVLWSDGTQWIVGTRRKQRDGATGELIERDRAEAFYGRLEHALSGLLDARLRTSNAETLEDLRDEIRAFRAELVPLFDPRVAA